jgi:hypothetical protein
MRKEDRTRLRREFEYLRGCSEMLSWFVLTNPSDDLIEAKLDKMQWGENGDNHDRKR